MEHISISTNPVGLEFPWICEERFSDRDISCFLVYLEEFQASLISNSLVVKFIVGCLKIQKKNFRLCKGLAVALVSTILD